MDLKEDNLNVDRPLLFRIVWLYYLATPAFFLAEFLWGITFRVPYFLTAPASRYLYYALCTACGVGCYFRPKVTYLIAFVESTINVTLLLTGFVSMMVTGIQSFIESENGMIPEVFTPKLIISFGITCTIWVISFYYGLWALKTKWKPDSELGSEIKSALFKEFWKNGPE
jgi:cellulose synthase/poly-beta-1,6-N-acetylglucosamine synthase-like glycosyltransferase